MSRLGNHAPHRTRPASTHGCVVEARGLGIRRGGRQLVEELNTSLTPARVLAVLGPNGAGKSSLLAVLAGLLQPSHGCVTLDGIALPRLSAQTRARRIAWQAGLPPSDFGLTLGERLRLADGGSARDTAARMAQALCCVDLETRSGQRLGELSAGERQRAELAAVLLRDAPVWLLDEPTAHLDLRHQVRWLGEVRRAAAAGRSVAIVLHDLAQAAAVADDVLLLSGRGARCGPASRMLARDVLEPVFGARLATLRHPDGRIQVTPDYGRRSPARPPAPASQANAPAGRGACSPTHTPAGRST